MRTSRAWVVLLFALGCEGQVSEMLGVDPHDAGASTPHDAGVVNTGANDAAVASDAGTGPGSIDAGALDAGALDSGKTIDAGPDQVAVFVLTGHMGRSTISCDDGRTWLSAQSDHDEFRCFEAGGNPDGGSSDCDHNPSAGHGVVYSNGTFVAAYGWGYPGSVRVSRDGVNWRRTLEGITLTRLVTGAGHTILGAGRTPRWSDDDGQTWRNGPEIDFNDQGNTIWNVRIASYAEGEYFMYAADGANRQARSSRDGVTWAPFTMPTTCNLTSIAGFNVGGGMMLFLGGQTACVSTDGTTFTETSLPAGVGGGLWDGEAFLIWGVVDGTYQRVLMRSTDGKAWSMTPTATRRALSDGGVMVGAGPDVGAVGMSATGTLVMVNGGWTNWYEKQQFYRSTDHGVTWDALPAGAFVGSHPVGGIAWGLVNRSESACPANP